MSQHEHDRRIDYVEFQTSDIERSKAFYSFVFGWSFTDFGPDYTSFEDGRLTGGFSNADAVEPGGPLIVIYAVDLSATEVAVREHGGSIVKGIFSFPGGERFHFADPTGNILAVWSDQ
jgi:predicted enzyme related to lactoylglutathione lyase